LLLAGLWAVQRWPIGAGVLLGCAAALKGPPLIVVPFLAWLGHWRCAIVAVVACVLLNILPDAVQPNRAGPPWVVVWLQERVAPLAAADAEPGKWHAAPWANHSLAGWQRRMLNYRLIQSATGEWEEVLQPSPLGNQAAKLLALAVLATLALAIVWRCKAWSAATAGAIVSLMLLASPMSSKPHFCVLALPAWVVARHAIERRNAVSLACVGLAALGLLSSAKDLVGPTVNSLGTWYGAVPLGTLLLLFGCVRVQALTANLNGPTHSALHTIRSTENADETSSS